MPSIPTAKRKKMPSNKPKEWEARLPLLRSLALHLWRDGELLRIAPADLITPNIRDYVRIYKSAILAELDDELWIDAQTLLASIPEDTPEALARREAIRTACTSAGSEPPRSEPGGARSASAPATGAAGGGSSTTPSKRSASRELF